MVERIPSTPTSTQPLPHRSPQQHSPSSSMSTAVPGTLRCINSKICYRLNPSTTPENPPTTPENPPTIPEYVHTLNNLCQENGWELEFTYERSGPQHDETWTVVVLSETSTKYLHPLLKWPIRTQLTISRRVKELGNGEGSRKQKLAGWLWRRMAGSDAAIPYVCFPLPALFPAIFSLCLLFVIWSRSSPSFIITTPHILIHRSFFF